MANLFDLAPRRNSVQLSVGDVSYGHVPTSRLPELIIGNLALAAIFNTGESEAETAVSILDVGRASPKLVAEIIAVGCGMEGDLSEAQRRVDEILPPGDQLALFTAIVDHTFPDGVSDFLARLFSSAVAVKNGITDGAEKLERVELTAEQAAALAASA